MVDVGSTVEDVGAALLAHAMAANGIGRRASKNSVVDRGRVENPAFGAPVHGQTPEAVRIAALQSRGFGPVLTALERLTRVEIRSLVPEGAAVALGTRLTGEGSGDVLFLTRDGLGIQSHDAMHHRMNSTEGLKRTRRAVLERRSVSDWMLALVRPSHWEHLDPADLNDFVEHLLARRWQQSQTHYPDGRAADRTLHAHVMASRRKRGVPPVLIPV